MYWQWGCLGCNYDLEQNGSQLCLDNFDFNYNLRFLRATI